MTSLVYVEGVSKSYRKKPILNDVSLAVEPGQILGLVGPNGAGKTTCLQAILGLTAYEGNIHVLGHEPKNGRHKMLNDVAYVSDVAVLPKWLKVSQALSYMQDVHPKFDDRKAREFLAKTKIPPHAKVKHLSKGMVTQLHLALILAIDAKVLILDEPTLGLDIVSRRQFYKHLLEDFYSEEKAIIVTTHQIEEIENILTHIAFINNGEILLSESADYIRDKYKLVSVTNDKFELAKTRKPLFTASMMGMHSMLFDSAESHNLSELGNIVTPTLADVFVGLVGQEAGA
ncbi:ABC transporter ATP-binding protein [Agaribacter marinus]|uniref:ABC transporter ATP-binding protein n=1 Tax=Agaribacter marinus TaxID=1431249 RepID=A0AA37T0K7_9ALTE|nr:ABC transporter ATP-binding protein [Agaribacter marinus]GLR71411.1 ABC transporter ATP-binding protein [Agaribacter marinus]